VSPIRLERNISKTLYWESRAGAQINFRESGRGLGPVTPTFFGSTIGYPNDSLASCWETHHVWCQTNTVSVRLWLKILQFLCLKDNINDVLSNFCYKERKMTIRTSAI